MKNEHKILLIILTISFLIRIPLLTTTLHQDEGSSIYRANQEITQLTKNIRYDYHGPIYYYTLWTWTKISNNIIYTRLLNVILTITTGIILYKILKKETQNTKLTLIGVTLYLFNPIIIQYSIIIRMYALATLLTITSYYTLKTNIKNKTIITPIIWTLMLLTHPLTILIILAEIIEQTINKKYKEIKELLKNSIIPIIIITLYYIPLLIKNNTELLLKHNNYAIQTHTQLINMITTFFIGPITIYSRTLLENIQIITTFLLFTTITIIYIIKKKHIKERKDEIVYITIFILTFLTLIILGIFNQYSLTTRYFIFIIPHATILLIKLIKTLNKNTIITIITIITIMFIIGYVNVHKELNKEKWNEIKTETNTIIIQPEAEMLNYKYYNPNQKIIGSKTGKTLNRNYSRYNFYWNNIKGKEFNCKTFIKEIKEKEITLIQKNTQEKSNETRDCLKTKYKIIKEKEQGIFKIIKYEVNKQ